MVSEHASPLAAIGGEDAGGQNVHVAALATHLARGGHDVTVWTRRDDKNLPRRVEFDGVAVEHVDAGPAKPIAKDQLLRWMDDFADTLEHSWAADMPDVIHSHFWMSGYAALRARPMCTPVVHTFHALGVVKRRHLGAAELSRDQEAKRLLRVARQAGVADRVQLRGAVARADVPTLLRSADVVVCTPWYEPFGIVPLEAMACGIPVVASAVGGMLDTVIHDVTGRLVKPKSYPEVAAAINQLMHDDFR